MTLEEVKQLFITKKFIEIHSGDTYTFAFNTISMNNKMMVNYEIVEEDGYAGQTDHLVPRQTDHLFCWRRF